MGRKRRTKSVLIAEVLVLNERRYGNMTRKGLKKELVDYEYA